MTTILLQLQGTILVYLFMGFVLKKINMIDDQASAFLSDFVLQFILPISVFNSCIQSFTLDSLLLCLGILVIAIIAEAALYWITSKKFPGFNEDQMRIARYGLLVSNGGLIGTPIVEGLYGTLGVMYANMFLIPTRIMAFVAGEGIFNPQKKKTFKETILNLLTNRVLVGMFLGMFFVIMRIQLPTFFTTAVSNVAKCMSPLSLILVGSMLAKKMEIHRKEVVEIAMLCGLRQFVVPVTLMLVLFFIPIDPIIKSVSILLLGMPVGSTSAIFANKYHGDTQFASASVFVSTLSSTITLVIVMSWIEKLLF